MSLPKSYRAFRRTAKAGGLPLALEKVVEDGPAELKANEVLIRIHPVSLNFRHVAMLNGLYPVEVEDKSIAASDCAAEVVSVGSGVHAFKVGDHVSPIFKPIPC
ncbi:Alcohol dehydrogenase superfamily zinc-containing [Macrophomina phaseolina MS6]|uniref:Alcohol dehydrogenase superfamily zinc-containing n=1 Tax=Macrophomina phaseolina (strain MS6) TaxID=1126212 RepID=K2S6V1_MACPH|nr:Alcohol dehydrogenase superfamily zinc-containing [Macrophomina phaseolina MS6]